MRLNWADWARLVLLDMVLLDMISMRHKELKLGIPLSHALEH